MDDTRRDAKRKRVEDGQRKDITSEQAKEADVAPNVRLSTKIVDDNINQAAKDTVIEVIVAPNEKASAEVDARLEDEEVAAKIVDDNIVQVAKDAVAEVINASEEKGNAKVTAPVVGEMQAEEEEEDNYMPKEEGEENVSGNEMQVDESTPLAGLTPDQKEEAIKKYFRSKKSTNAEKFKWIISLIDEFNCVTVDGTFISVGSFKSLGPGKTADSFIIAAYKDIILSTT